MIRLHKTKNFETIKIKINWKTFYQNSNSNAKEKHQCRTISSFSCLNKLHLIAFQGLTIMDFKTYANHQIGLKIKIPT